MGGMALHGGAEARAPCICFPASAWGLVLDFSHSWAADKEVLPFTENSGNAGDPIFFFFLFFFYVGWLIVSLQEVLRFQTSPSSHFFASNYVQRQGNHRHAFVEGSEFPKYRHFIHHFHSHSILPDHTYAQGD